MSGHGTELTMQQTAKFSGLEIVLSRKVEFHGRQEMVCLVTDGEAYGVLIDILDGYLVYAPHFGKEALLHARKTAKGILSIMNWTTRAEAIARYNGLLLERGLPGRTAVEEDQANTTNVLMHPLLARNEKKQSC
jgi:hypothetical protein